jgi:mono/diheme cytochrome c family protein
VEVLEPAAAAEAPEDETPEPEIEPEPVPVRTGLPRWLVAAFMVVPSIGLLYALVSPAGPDCGSSGALAIDPETGVAENCDGTEYGVDASDLFSIGQELYDGRCASCHGGNGGGGVGPAFTNGAVLATFSSCADHVEWVVIGSNAWPEPTYGDNATPVLGSGVAMPGFEGQLTLEEIIAVSLYERVAFGGEDRAAADENCAADEEMLAAP